MSAGCKTNEESTSTREAILDATEAIMVEDGYSAVTSRRVAEKAGLKSQLVHYYFRTMDDLFTTVYERTEKDFERHLRAVSSENPLRALWDLNVHPKRMRLSQEFIALSNHRKSMRKISGRIMEQTQSINEVFIAKYLQEADLDPAEYPPVVISHLLTGLSRTMINRDAMGVSSGHSEVFGFADRWLSWIEARHKQRARRGEGQAAVTA